MVALYRAAIVALPSWSDDAIMNCDMARLNIAIIAAQEAERNRLKLKVKLAGFRWVEPTPEPATDEEFNRQAADAIQALFV